MGNFAKVKKDIFSIFGTADWRSHGLATFPINFIGQDKGDMYLVVDPVVSASTLKTARGILIVDIYVPFNEGPDRIVSIADLLDSFMLGKTLATTSGCCTQFFESNLNRGARDKDNPGLFKTQYSINFNFYGV